MEPDRWQQIKTIFHAAVDRPPADRGAFLAGACGHDPELRAEVEALLSADAPQDQFLLPPTTQVRTAASAADTSGFSPDVGSSIGPYRLERELGRGGMGTVYLAARADGQYVRQVAIKLIQPGLARAGALRRFRLERETLARLDHPNIARLLDAVIAPDGRPGFVMEYIDGLPITRFVRQRRLTVEDRLQLFCRVCGAVHYAHQNLVVHRDLKPANILVTRDGEPKLLDFGIAKLLDAESGESPRLTVSGLRPMTPEYAAPEQVRGEVVTTATDVYALGVLLYELLTGSRPYEFRNESASEIERIVCVHEPRRPSDAVTGDCTHGSRPRDSSADDGQVLLRRRHLAGDLDTITLKALRKEPNRRYLSAEQLAEDIRRHLAGLPVTARRDTFVYRASKFVRRNKGLVIASTLIGLSLTAGLIATAVQTNVATQRSRQAERARRIADLARQQAEVERSRARDAEQAATVEASKAERITAFIRNMLASVDPAFSRGREVTVREMLDAAAERVSVELADEPEVEAAVRSVIGSSYQQLGRYSAAEPQLRAAWELRKAHLGEFHRETLVALDSLAALLSDAGRLEEALQLAQVGLAAQRSRLPPDNPDVTSAINTVATLLRQLGRLEEAQTLQLEVYQRELDREGAPDLAAVSAGCNLATAMLARDRFAEVVALMRQVLPASRAQSGNDHPLTLYAATILGTALGRAGEYEEGEALLRETAAIQERVLGPRHPNTLTTLHNLADLLEGAGKHEAAEALFRTTLETARAVLGSQDPFTCALLHNLSVTLRSEGKLREAEACARRAYETQRDVLGENHYGTVIARAGLAECLIAEKRFDEAEEHLRAALEGLRRNFGDESRRTRQAEALLKRLHGGTSLEEVAPESTSTEAATDP